MSERTHRLSRTRRLLGIVRGSSIVENLLLLGVLLVIDGVFFGHTRFAGITPHPFWLVVLLPSMQYGSREGLLGAILASAALLIDNVPAQPVTQDFYDYLFAILKLPLLWLGAAVLFGEIRMRHSNRSDELVEQLEESSQRAETLAGAYKRLDERRERLEASVASQLQTVTTLYQATRAIESLEAEDVLPGALKALENVLSPYKASVFALRGDELEVVAHTGWTDEDRLAQRYSSESALLQAVIGGQRVLAAGREDDEAILAGHGLLAGPLLDSSTGTIYGMLKVESLDFVRLGPGSIRNFQVLCEWVAVSYGKSLRHQEAERDRVLDGQTHLYSGAFLPRQIEYLAILARRMGFDLSRIDVSISNSDSLTQDEQETVARILRDSVDEVLRRTDMAFRGDEAAYSFTLLLPGTPLANTEIVIRKLREALASRLPEWFDAESFSFKVRDLHAYERPVGSRELLVGGQIQFLRDLSQRLDFDLPVLVLRCENPAELVEQDRLKNPGAIQRAIAASLPESTPVFVLEQDQNTTAVALPGMSATDAELAGQRVLLHLEAEMQRRNSRSRFSCSAGAADSCQASDSGKALSHA